MESWRKCYFLISLALDWKDVFVRSSLQRVNVYLGLQSSPESFKAPGFRERLMDASGSVFASVKTFGLQVTNLNWLKREGKYIDKAMSH